MVKHLLARLRRDRRGMAAVEFAMILPIMLALFFGAWEVADGMQTSRRVSHVSSALSDLVGQAKTISNSDRDNIFDAAASIMYPYATSGLKIVLTQVKIDKNGKATVDWSEGYNTSALTKGAAVAVPADLKQADTYLVMAQVTYGFKPTYGYMITGTIDVSDQFYIRPRRSNSISRT